MASEIVKKILHPPELPNVVKGDGRYLMTLLRNFLAEQAMQINAANSFTADDVRKDIEGTRLPIRNFRLTFDQLGGHLTWDSVQNLENFKCYEVRENQNVGSDAGLLERTPETHSDRLPTSYVGRIYLYAIDKSGQASTPLTLHYTKQRPTKPLDLALTRTNEGTVITFLEIPYDCMGAYIYVNGKRYASRSNLFLYTDTAIIKKLEVAYFDQFGEGECGVLYLVMPAVENFSVERNGASLDYAWDALPIYNVRYEVRVGVTAAWEKALTLFTTKLNKHRYVYPNTGDCYMLIKAIDEHGNYSEDAAYYFLTNTTDIHKNVILRLEQEAFGYPGMKDGLYYDAAQNALLLEQGVLDGTYLIDVRLPQTYRARNWLAFQVIGAMDSGFVFDDLDFLYDSQKAVDTMWNGTAGDISGVEARTEIAIQTEESRGPYTAMLPLNQSLVGENVTATGKGKIAYREGRWHNGLVLSERSEVTGSVAIGETFGLVFWLRLQGPLFYTEFLTLTGEGGVLSVGYDDGAGAYTLTGSDGVTMTAEMPYQARDHLLFGVSQTKDTRMFFLYSAAARRTVARGAKAAPLGAFTGMRLGIEGGMTQ